MNPSGLIQKILVQIATVGPVGRLPVAPGTWGSLFAVIVWWSFLSVLNPLYFYIIIILTTILAILASNYAERSLGRDAHAIVIDEVVGQWLVLVFCQKTVLTVMISFFLFRWLDILKPFPIGRSQNLKGGWGVVIDDLLAGIYAAICVVIIQWIWL